MSDPGTGHRALVNPDREGGGDVLPEMNTTAPNPLADARGSRPLPSTATFTQSELARMTGVSCTLIYLTEQRAIAKLREGLLNDPLIRDWLNEHKITAA